MNAELSRSKIVSNKVDFITGACMLIKTDILKKIGLLPEKYFLYFEDSFYCQKIRKNGYSCYLVAEPLVSHEVSTSTGKAGTNRMSPLRAYYFARNPLLYIRSEVHGVYSVSNYFGQFFIRLPYYLLVSLKNRDFEAIPSYFRGMIDGLTKNSS
jgi:hypothetical protein